LRIALQAPSYERFGEYLQWQDRRLRRLGVDVSVGKPATLDLVIGTEFETIAFATGAHPHRPAIPGAEPDTVLDIRDVLLGAARAGHRVLIVAQDDHMPPLALADFLSARGHAVTLVYATPAPAILLGRYSVGAPLARLDERGVEVRVMQEVIAIGRGEVELRNIYSGRTHTIGNID